MIRKNSFPRILLTLLLLFFGNAGAAVIVTYRGDSPNLFNLEFPYLTDVRFDIDADGISDFHFIGGYFVATVEGFGTNQFIATLSGGLVSLPAGSMIGGDTTSLPGDWRRHMDNPIGGGFGLSGMQYANGYLGVSFEAADGIHYGWIQYVGFSVAKFPVLDDAGNVLFYINGINRNGGFIDSWAYESEPGKPIFAGVVPEPTLPFLLLAGSLVAWGRRRR